MISFSLGLVTAFVTESDRLTVAYVRKSIQNETYTLFSNSYKLITSIFINAGTKLTAKTNRLMDSRKYYQGELNLKYASLSLLLSVTVNKIQTNLNYALLIKSHRCNTLYSVGLR